MKKLPAALCVFILFFIVGAFYANAQDLIVLKDGNMIEAKVMEISQSEIRYKRPDNLDGPMFILPSANVLSIKYENGTIDIINSPAASEKESVMERVTVMEKEPPGMDPDEFYFGIYADPSGFLLYGPSVLAEFTKNHFNAQVLVNFPSLGLVVKSDSFGIGFGASFNYLWHTRIGGFYLGGLFDYNGYKVHVPGLIKMPDGKYTDGYYDFSSENPWQNNFALAVNLGFKFVLSSGVSFNTGGNIGAKMARDFHNHNLKFDFLIRPNITLGYNF